MTEQEEQGASTHDPRSQILGPLGLCINTNVFCVMFTLLYQYQPCFYRQTQTHMRRIHNVFMWFVCTWRGVFYVFYQRPVRFERGASPVFGNMLVSVFESEKKEHMKHMTRPLPMIDYRYRAAQSHSERAPSSLRFLFPSISDPASERALALQARSSSCSVQAPVPTRERS